MIENILDNFDFDKVRKVMGFLQWEWCDVIEETSSVPSTYKIVCSARDRLEKAYEYAIKNKENATLSSGGFEAFAQYNKETNEVDYLELKFVLTSWDEEIHYE